MERRDFFKKAIVTAGAAAVGTSTLKAGETVQPVDNRKTGTEMKAAVQKQTTRETRHIAIQPFLFATDVILSRP